MLKCTYESKYHHKGRKPGPVVKGGNLESEGREFEPDTGWTFFTLICYKFCIVCLKKTENKQIRGRGWPIF